MARGHQSYTSHIKDSVAHTHKWMSDARKVRWPHLNENHVKGTAKGHGQKARGGRRAGL